jgi:restriction endonuclease S subunit
LSDWPTPPLGTLVDTLVPARDKPTDLTGEIPWVRIEDFDGKYIGASKSGQGVSAVTIAAMNLRVFPPGTVVCTCSCDMGTTAIVQRALITNQTFIGLKPRSPALLSDYLYYALMAAKPELNAKATGAIQTYLSRDDFRHLRLPMPPPKIQRTIVDFLDRETVRIDALILAKRQMIELLEERVWSHFVQLVESAQAPIIALRRAITFITDGPFGSAFSSDDYAPHGAAVVRLGNIGFAEYRPAGQAFIPIDLFSRFLRCRVRAGDLLIAGLGDPRNHAGRACVAPDLGPAIVKGKCFCARVDSTLALPEYLALLLSSPVGAEAVGFAAHGSTREMINLEIVKSTPILLPTLGNQERIVRDVRAARATTSRTKDALLDQVDLLTERRQALITAAVTGQIPVPGGAA